MADLLGVIEAGYDLGATDREWMQAVTNAIGPLIDGGHGVYGTTIDASGGFMQTGKEVHTFRGRQAIVAAVHETNARLPGPLIERTYLHGKPILAASEVIGPGGWDRYARPYGPPEIADCLAVIVTDPRGVGCMVIAPIEHVQAVGPRVRASWGRVTAHLSAMQRLRRSLAAEAKRPADGEAVLDPSGKIEHAVGAARAGSARESLREAAVLRERARGRLRREDAEEATKMWHALVAGRWSMIDRFERDGRRYLIAHENDPKAPAPRALTHRERQVVTFAGLGHSNKLIAYELGLSLGSVSAYLASAMRKLGFDSRVDLVRVYRASWMRRARRKGE